MRAWSNTTYVVTIIIIMVLRLKSSLTRFVWAVLYPQCGVYLYASWSHVILLLYRSILPYIHTYTIYIYSTELRSMSINSLPSPISTAHLKCSFLCIHHSTNKKSTFDWIYYNTVYISAMCMRIRMPITQLESESLITYTL